MGTKKWLLVVGGVLSVPLISGLIFVNTHYIRGNETPWFLHVSSEPGVISTKISIASKDLSEDDVSSVAKLWELTNIERQKAGLKALQLDVRLNKSSVAKCEDMVSRNYWSHNDPQGKEPWHFFEAQDVHASQLGENQAAGYEVAVDLIRSWMDSPEHKKNILQPAFTAVGFGICSSESFVGTDGRASTISVQHFVTE